MLRTHISSLRRTLVICIIWWGFYPQTGWPFAILEQNCGQGQLFRSGLTRPRKLRKPERENGVLSFVTRRRSCPDMPKGWKKLIMSGLLYLNISKSDCIMYNLPQDACERAMTWNIWTHLLTEYDSLTVRLSQIRWTPTSSLGEEHASFYFHGNKSRLSSNRWSFLFGGVAETRICRPSKCVWLVGSPFQS